MRNTSLLILACGMAVASYTPASAQANIDCGTPQNAITYYCMHRDEFKSPPAASPKVAPSTGGAPSGPTTTGSVMTAPPRAPMMDQHAASCMQRYRSYDPATNTFMGRSGRRYTCQ